MAFHLLQASPYLRWEISTSTSPPPTHLAAHSRNAGVALVFYLAARVHQDDGPVLEVVHYDLRDRIGGGVRLPVEGIDSPVDGAIAGLVAFVMNLAITRHSQQAVISSRTCHERMPR